MNKSYLAGRVKALDTTSATGEFEVILSAPTLDRDGEVIATGAFEPLPDHITFDVDHGMSTATTVGSGVPRYEDGNLVVRGTFSSIPRAQEVRSLVAEGHIRTTSVAYMAPKVEVRDGVPHIVKAELLNGAFVAVPANRQALVLAAKTARREAALPGLKTIAGSFEERRDQISQAIRLANPDAWWSYVIATFDSTVVYEVETRDSLDRYEADYEVADDGAVSLTNVRPVEVVEVVQPATEDASSDAPGADAAAVTTAAASPPVALRHVQALALAMAEGDAASVGVCLPPTVPA